MILSSFFYQRSDVLGIAKDLLGKVIITEKEEGLTSAIIVETEAYRAPDDKGSHAYGNLRTARTEVMFAAGGIAYVYLCYGIHHLFNVVSGTEGKAHAVLIRAVQPLSGLDIMSQRRLKSQSDINLTNGPGKFTQAMGINISDNTTSLFYPSSKIRIESNDFELSADDIIEGPRVGIAYAGTCANNPWRYRIKDNPWTSKPDKVVYEQKQ